MHDSFGWKWENDIGLVAGSGRCHQRILRARWERENSAQIFDYSTIQQLFSKHWYHILATRTAQSELLSAEGSERCNVEADGVTWQQPSVFVRQDAKSEWWRSSTTVASHPNIVTAWWRMSILKPLLGIRTCKSPLKNRQGCLGGEW